MYSSKLYQTATVCLFISATLSLSSCKHDAQILDGLDTVCFETQIQPIIQSSCAVSGCHDAVSREEGYNFTTYENIVAVVKPGNARQSKLYHVITAVYAENMMPPDQPLSMDDRNLIKIWIGQGAKNTKCSPVVTSSDPTGKKNDTICFNQDILPLLSSSCASSGCHDAVSAREGYIINSYTNIVSRTNLVKPGNYSQSKLYKVITDQGEDRMPPSPATPLTRQQIDKIKTWISHGAINSNCVALNCDTSGTISFNTQIWPIVQNNCLGCHPAAGSNNSVNLGNYTQIKNVSGTMRNGSSLLAGTIHHLSGFVAMPQNGTLDDCKIGTVDKWITQGMANN